MAGETYRGSAGVDQLISALPFPQLQNIVRAMADGRKGEEYPGQRRALEAEIASRPAPAPPPVRQGPAPLGDNAAGAPTDAEILAGRVEEHLEGLRARHAPLFTELAMLELEAMLLPEKVTTEEELATLRTHVASEKRLAGKLDKAREAEKAPLLIGGRKIDETFFAQVRPLKARSGTLEERAGVYLRAKAAAEEARRRAIAAAAAEEARVAREREEAERQRQRDAEAAQVEATRKLAAAATDAERNAAALEVAEHGEAARLSGKAAEEAVAEQGKAERRVETNERIADRGGHAKSSGAGASANLKTDRVVEVDLPTLREAFAPLTSFLTAEELQRAAEKADKVGVALPGCVGKDVDRAVITATRTPTA